MNSRVFLLIDADPLNNVASVRKNGDVVANRLCRLITPFPRHSDALCWFIGRKSEDHGYCFGRISNPRLPPLSFWVGKPRRKCELSGNHFAVACRLMSDGKHIIVMKAFPVWLVLRDEFWHARIGKGFVFDALARCEKRDDIVLLSS